MTVKKLIEKLSEVDQDLEVMFQDSNSYGGPFSIERLNVEVADEDEYPEDFGMPEGFTFVLLEN